MTDHNAVELLEKWEAEWGPEVVPNVRIKPAGDHFHDIEFCSREMLDAGYLFELVDTIDDREGPSVNAVAAKRLRDAADELRQAADLLDPA